MSLDELSPEERGLVFALRELPESPLRARTLSLVREFLDFAAAPGCAEEQADGVPCTTAQAACDECRKVISLVEGLRGRLHAS
jgi:hypothetical protein